MQAAAVAHLGRRRYEFWDRFRGRFRNATRDASAGAWVYLRGQLRLTSGRNFTGMATEAHYPVQRLQHFMSYSPWSAAAVWEQLRAELAHLPDLPPDGVLLLEESATERSGDQSAGGSPAA